MRSSDVTAGTTIYASDVNKLRDDAFASSWLLAHEQTSPGLTLKVENGTCYINNVRIDYAGGNSASFTAPVTNPRIDLLSIDISGTLVRTAGTEAVSPVAPTLPTNQMAIAQIYNRVGQTSIKDTDDSTNGYIQKDLRPFLDNQSKTFLKFIAEMDLTAGNPVGLSVDKSDVVAKGTYTVATTPTVGTTRFNPDDIIFLDDDKFLIVYNADTSNLTKVVCGTINRSTMNITLGNEVTVITPYTTFSGVRIVKLDTDKFAIAYIDSGWNALGIKTYSISGTTITVQNTSNMSVGASCQFSEITQITTNEVLVMSNGSTTRRVDYITWSGYVPTIIHSINGFGTSNAWAPYPNRMVKVDTGKIIAVSGSAASSSNHIMCFSISGGTITAGAELMFGGGVDINGSNLSIVSYTTNRALVRKKDSTTNGILYSVVGLSGTTCSFLCHLYYTDTDGESSSKSGRMVYQASSGKVIEYVNKVSSTSNAIYQITPSDSVITRKIISSNINIIPTLDIFVMANNPTNDYYIIMAGIGASSAQLFIRGMSSSLLGFAQSTVSRGAEVIVRRDGDTNQTGLIAGATYKVSNGALINTSEFSNNLIVTAKSSTEILR